MATEKLQHLSRRERQIMDVLYQHNEASAQEVMQAIPEPPGYSAVRALLAALERKGFVDHRQDGARYLYYPAITHQSALKSALRRLVRVFFAGSPVDAAASLIETHGDELSAEDLARLAAMIEAKRGKRKTRGG